jgi:L-gulonolactone oxidase
VPVAVRKPSTTAEVATIVADASRSGHRVKAFGAGHSFTAAAMTNGVLLSLDAMNVVERVDATADRVTVQAGVRLRDLCDELAAVGLTMPNLGDVNAQSIAGAINTATHGTGADLGNLATTIVGMELVTGRGDVVWCDSTTRPDLLRVARVGVGALGIVTKVTIQCVPAFDLHAVETIEVLDDVLDDFEAFFMSAEHVEFYWMPGGAGAVRSSATIAPPIPFGRSRGSATCATSTSQRTPRSVWCAVSAGVSRRWRHASASSSRRWRASAI